MFKNATTYVLQKSIQEIFSSTCDLEFKLAEFSHRPIESTDIETLGWVEVIPGSESLIHTIGDDFVLRLRRDTKVIPNDAVMSELSDKIYEIQKKHGRVVTKNERNEMKETIIQKHLPTAPVKTKYHHVLVSQAQNMHENLLIVDTSSTKISDEVTAFLRKSIGSLPARTLSCLSLPSNIFRTWIQDLNDPDHLGNECVLVDADGKGQISFTNQEDLSDATNEHLDNGMVVKQIMVKDSDRSFVVNDSLTLKKIKPEGYFEDEYTNSIEGLEIYEADHFLNRAMVLTTIEWLVRKMGGVAKLDL